MTGVIAGFDSASRYLPSEAVQRARQQSLPPAPQLQTRLSEALVGLPVSAAVLQPFLADVEQARTAALLRRADLEGTSFAAAVDALLVPTAGGYSALLPIAAAGSVDLSDAGRSAGAPGDRSRQRARGAAGPEGRDQPSVSRLPASRRSSCHSLGFAAIVLLLGVRCCAQPCGSCACSRRWRSRYRGRRIARRLGPFAHHPASGRNAPHRRGGLELRALLRSQRPGARRKARCP